MMIAFACSSEWANAAGGNDAFPGTIRVAEDVELTLNGHGERTIFFFHVYAIGLYLPQRRSTLEGVLSLSGRKRLQLHMQRELSAKTVRDYLVKRMSDGSQPEEMAVLRTRMDDISLIIDSAKVLRKGDVLALDFVPGKGTVISINDISHGNPIDGDKFFHALLRIWLGERVRNHALRDALLGRITG